MDLSAERWVEVDPEFQVKVEFVNGIIAERGPLRAVSKQTAGDHRLEGDGSGNSMIQEYLADEDVAIREHEAVVSIGGLTFPACKVYVIPETLPGVDGDAAQAIKDNGLDRLDRLLAAAQSDLAAIQPIGWSLARIKSHVRDIVDIAGSQSSVSTTGGGPECEYCGDPVGDTPIEDSTSRTYCSIGCLNDDHLDA